MRIASLVALAALVSGCTELATCARDDTCESGLRCGDDCYAVPAPDAGPACASDEDCDDGLFCDGVERCDPTDLGADARGCVPSARPCARCDEASDACEDCADLDGDGHADVACGGDDCDDANPGRFPGNVEVCDVEGADEDCDPATYGVRDADGDASPDATCCNGDACGTDCDDARPDVRPTAPEICDGLDNDCDGATDEERAIVDWYPDLDGDLFGDASATPVPSCAPLPDHAPNDRDCDDGAFEVRPGATEVCDGDDQDCDGAVDEGTIATFYRDADRDGYGTDEGAMTGCREDLPVGYSFRGGDCMDAASGDPRIVPSYFHPGAPEVCDGLVNDCAGWSGSDASPPRSTVEDEDGDGFASPDAPCLRGPFELDCADEIAGAFPGQTATFDRPYCVDGGPVCRSQLDDAVWRCQAPLSDGTCPNVIGSSPPRASFDYDCDGEETPARPILGCTCSPSGCRESLSGDRTEGPDYAAAPSACGTATPWRRCLGSCASDSCSVSEIPISEGRQMPCR